METEQDLEELGDAQLRKELKRGYVVEGSYTAPSEEPDGWELSGVVRVDVVVMAIHLATARSQIRTFTGLSRRQIDGIKRVVVEESGKWVAGKVFSEAIIALISFVQRIRNLGDANGFQKSVEEGIRRGFLRTMRELKDMGLKRNNKPRVRKLVSSRNHTPKQRRKNGYVRGSRSY